MKAYFFYLISRNNLFQYCCHRFVYLYENAEVLNCMSFNLMRSRCLCVFHKSVFAQLWVELAWAPWAWAPWAWAICACLSPSTDASPGSLHCHLCSRRPWAGGGGGVLPAQRTAGLVLRGLLWRSPPGRPVDSELPAGMPPARASPSRLKGEHCCQSSTEDKRQSCPASFPAAAAAAAVTVAFPASEKRKLQPCSPAPRVGSGWGGFRSWQIAQHF